MKHILSPSGLHDLAAVTSERVLLGFDFDGTLAPLVREHRLAQMTPRTSDLFARVCKAYPCAVISGRARDDVAGRLGDARPDFIVGNHGLESGEQLEDYEHEMRDVRQRIQAAIDAIEGADIEDKRYSLSIHYRGARDALAARAKIQEALVAVPHPLRVIEGAFVVNLVAPRAPDKGDALLHLRELARANVTLYVGDDVTDEDAFDRGRHGGLLGIRVGESTASAATHFVRDQAEVDGLLQALLDLRPD